MDFKRHLQPEYTNKKRAAKSNALGLFQLVELSLLELLPSRAQVRFSQRNKIIFLTLTQFIEHSLEHSPINIPFTPLSLPNLPFFLSEIPL